MQRKQSMHARPAYFNGQLLLADDFIREQRFHIDALNRHTLELHGAGVVRGLEVTRLSDRSISIGPGVAIDARGRLIVLEKAETIDLQGAQAAGPLAVTIGIRSEAPGGAGQPGREIESYAFVRVAVGVEAGDAVLATLHLDEHGRLPPEGLSLRERRVLQRLAPGSVTPESLDERLRTGWLRMPFRPHRIPEDVPDAPPPFRVGRTETVAHKLKGATKEVNKDGAGGTMAIALPPGVSQILKLRVAGSENEKKLHVDLYRGGWDAANQTHVAVSLVQAEIGAGSYDRTFDIAREQRALDLESSTLSIRLMADGYVRVSLIAVQVSY